MKTRFFPGLTSALQSSRLLVGSITMMLGVNATFAAPYYWDTTTTGLWATGANWSTNATGSPAGTVVPLATDTAVFNGSGVNGNVIVQLGAATSIAGITFNNTGTTTIQSDSATARLLTIGTSGITIASTAGAVTLGNSTNIANIALSGTQTWTNNSTTNALTVVNGITNTANTTAFVLTVTGAGNTTLNGVISNGGTTGTIGLTKTGTGQLLLSNANSFTGGIVFTGTVSSNTGTIRLSNGQALGPDATVKTVDMTTNNTNGIGAFELTNGITVNNKNLNVGGRTSNSGIYAHLRNVSGDNTWNGNFSVNTTGGGGVIESQSGTLTLGGTLTTAVVSSARAITFLGAGTTRITGTTQNGGAVALGLTQGGPGTLTLQQATSTHTGGVNLNSGTLNLNVATALGGTAGGFTIASGTLDSTATFTNQTLTTNNAQAWNGDFTFTGTNNLNLGTGAVTLNASRQITVSANTLTVGGVIGGTGFGLTKLGTGTLALNGANTFSGTTTISNGKIKLGNNLALQNSAYDTTGSTGAIGLDATGFTTPTLGGAVGSVDLGTAITGYGSITALTLNPASGVAVNYSGVIAEGASGMTLKKSGTGAQTLSGSSSNTYTGTTSVLNAGLLTLAKTSGAIAIPGNISLDGTTNNNRVEIGTVATAGTIGQQFGVGTVISFTNNTTATHVYFKLFGNNQTIAGLSEVVSLGGVVENSELETNFTTSSILMIDNSADYSFAGYFRDKSSGTGTTGTLGLTKMGLSMQTLSGAQIIYTGPTSLNAGTLGLTGTTGGASVVTFGTGTATLQVNSASQIGGLATTSGALNTNALVQAGSASAVLTVNQAGNSTFGGILQNNNSTSANLLGLTKNGAGTLTISGANSYSGATAITGGTLVAGNVAAFGTTSAISLTNGTTGGTLQLSTDTSVNAYAIGGSTGAGAGTVVSDRATAGAGITHVLGSALLGNNTYNFTKGANVNSGTAALSLASLNLAAGTAGTVVLNPTTADLSVLGAANIGSGNNAKTLQLNGTSTGSSIAGAISNGLNTLTLTKLGVGTWTLGGANSYTGITTVGGGTLILTNSSTGAGATNVTGGTLQAGAANALNPNSTLTTTNLATAVVDLNNFNNAIGALAGGGASGGNVTLGSGTLTTGGNNASTTFSGDITGTGGLIKSGTGVLTLSSALSYGGSTQISGGSLIVDSTLASSGTTVADTGTLGGTGTLAALVRVNSGGNLSAATATTAGSLTLGSLTLDAGSTLAYEFGTTSDLVAVTGASGLTINGGTLNLYATGGVAPLTADGTYTLFSYVTAFNGSINSLNVGNSQFGKVYSVGDTSSAITLKVGTATTSDWTGGANDGLWTTAGNWTGGTPNSVGAIANFGMVPGTSTSVAVDSAKIVGSIGFDNANVYTITGGPADTITIDNGIASGFIAVTSGSQTISAPIVLNSHLSVTPAASTMLTLGGIISGAKAVTFNGAGTTVITGVNTYSGATNISAGTVRLGNGGADGNLSSTGTINAGTLVINRSNAVAQGSDFCALIFGTAALVQSGAGTTTLAAGNTYTGGTTINAGTLALGASNSLANTGAVTVSGGIFDLGANSDTVGAVTLNNGSITSTSGVLTGTSYAVQSGTISAILAGTAGLTKTTVGAVTLSGANTYTGNTTVSGGTLNITGTYTGNNTTSALFLGNTAANTVVNVSNDMTLNRVTGANITGSATAYNQTAGTVNTTLVGVGSGGSYVANIGYGYFNLTGGTFKSNGSFSIGTLNAASNAVAYVGGTGTLDWSGTGNQTVAYASAASLTVGPGGSVSRGASANTTWLATNANSVATINIAGGSLDLGTAGNVYVTNTASATSVSISLAGGTLTMGKALATNGGTTGTFYANYAGGTLKASANLTNPMNVLTSVSTIFGAIDNFAAVGNTSQNFTGGMTVDTNGFNLTYGNTLRGASANGVQQSNVAVTGGSGYIGAPLVKFIGGTLAANGTPASGYAVISGGVITGIVITSPGTYTVDPTVTLSGGGGTGASVALSTLSANVADTGLTKTGSGTLTLSGANTYAGATVINAGKLVVNGDQSLATGATTVAAGTLTNTSIATLAGNGTVGGNVSLAAESAAGFKNGGVLAPTASPNGTALDVAGSTTFGTGSIFEWNLVTADESDPGANTSNFGSYGQLAGTGAITGSDAVFRVVLSGNTFASNFWYTSKTWTNVFSGAGATIALDTLFTSFDTSGGLSSSGVADGRGQFTFNGSTSTLTWSAVPEPTTALSGLLLGAGLMRRRRSA